MPVTWEIQGAILVVRLAGAFDLRDLDQAKAQVLEDPRFHPGLCLLLDARLSEADASVARIQRYVAFGANLGDMDLAKRWALVVHEKSLVRYGMSRVLAAYLGLRGVDMLVTRDIVEALKWLAGRDPVER